MRGRLATLAAVLIVTLVLAPSSVHAQEPILEHYSLRVGSPDAAGVEAHVRDQYFGNGSAQSKIIFTGPVTLGDPRDTGSLVLRVWRTVERGQITFALLVFRVAVRGYNESGELVYSRRLNGFTFGDSASGSWRRELDSVPASVSRIDVVFFGNYE